MSGTITAAVPRTNATPTTAGTPGAAASAAARLGGDMQTFLTMLTTQLRNQDPTQPLDPNEFTAQLSQFAAVEQQIAVNQHLDSLISLQRSANMLGASQLVGRTVEMDASSLALRAGQAQALRLPAAEGQLRQARITISDGTGQVVREVVAALGSATTDWQWDGRDANGRAVADGSYRVAAVGLDAAGTQRGTITPGVSGTVTKIARQGEVAMLSIGALSVPVDALRHVRP